MEYLQFRLQDDCACTLGTCPTVIAQRRLKRLSPRMAVEEAATEAPNSLFLCQLATATLPDPRYRRSGVVTVFIRHILQGQATEDKRHWEFPVQGIINVFAGINQTRSELEDAAILQEMHSSYRGILDAISKDFSFLAQTGSVADRRRVIVAKLIYCFLYDAGMKQAMYDEKTAKLVLQCWLGTAPDSPFRKIVALTADVMFAGFDHLGNTPPLGRLQLAYNSYKITTFVSQVNFGLKHKKMLGETLSREVSTLCDFVSAGKPFLPRLVEGGVHKQVAAAVRRHLKDGGDDSITGDILEHTGVFMQHLLQQSNDTMAMFTELLANTCIVEIGAASLKLANKSRTDEANAWYEIFERIKHSMTCSNFNDCKFHATPPFLEAAQTSLERLAIPTMIALQEEVPVGGEMKYLVLWTQVVRLLGITDRTIRERYRVDRKCCNIGCPARNSGNPNSKRSTCTKCKSVFYCDRVCQASDWKTHKAECERLARSVGL